MSEKITSNNLFKTTLGAELVTEMLKAFMMDMMLQQAEANKILKKNPGTKETSQHEIDVFDDILHATGELILEVNKYREKPESKMEIVYDLLIGDDEEVLKVYLDELEGYIKPDKGQEIKQEKE